MKSIFVILVTLLSLNAHSHSDKKSSIQVEDAYIRLLPPSASNTGGFIKLSNSSKKDLRLVKASSGISKKLELHTLIKDGNIMKMREVKDILIGANSSTELKPGSFHLMFMDLQKPLKLNDVHSVKLFFNDSNHIDVDFKVLNK